MSIEGNSTYGFVLTGEHADQLYGALNDSFDEAMHAASQLLNLQGDTHVGKIELLPDGSIRVMITDHLLGDTIYIGEVMSR